MPVRARLTAALAALVLTCAPSMVSARTLQLGSSFEAVKADFPAVQREASGGEPRIMSLHDVEHAGVRWALVEFIFDARNRLAAVRLQTKSASLERVQSLVLNQMQHPEAALLAADAPGSETMHIRLCQNSADGVTVTLERPAFNA